MQEDTNMHTCPHTHLDQLHVSSLGSFQQLQIYVCATHRRLLCTT